MKPSWAISCVNADVDLDGDDKDKSPEPWLLAQY
jgi:hypothetical protein